MCNNESSRNCIAELLKVILVLQQNATGDNSLDSCDRPSLGGGVNCLVCNTRPIMLYTCCGNNEPVSMPISKDETSSCARRGEGQEPRNCSSVFRVEKLDNNCATFRVLTENPDENAIQPWIATNSFFTMNLDCACIVRCLNDCYVDCVC